jgi:LuxR family transcriptional regulator, maltose regulon positive regulatory protein
MSFARTKLLPPRPRAGALIDRPLLQQRLADALRTQRLVLLCAAAGYGKTAALARQVTSLGADTALAWIAADEGDDLALLIACLAAALEPWDPPWRTAPEALAATAGDASPRERRLIADELINTLDACEVAHGVIVIDDLHRIDDPAVHAFLDHLLERLSPRWALALTTRVEPPLALARLRAAGELAEFRQDDLRFDAEETRQLAAAAGVDAAQADALVRRTGGWAAGLRLAVDALRRGAAGTGGADGAAAGGRVERPLLDFLDAEVIDHLPAELRDFLLRTSLLPELSTSRAAAVSGNPRAAALLDEVLRHGLFVTSHDGAAEPTLRLHDLLREALQRRLRRDHADELPALLRRAAVGEPDERRRIGWLLQAGAADEAQRTLAEATPALLAAGDSARVLRLLEAFPPALREASPLLNYVHGLAAWPRFEWSAMDRHLAQAANGFAGAGQAALARRARAWRIVALAGLGRLGESRGEHDALTGEAQVPGAAPADREVDAHLELMGFWLSGACGPADGPARHLRAMLAALDGADSPALWYRCAPHFMFIGRAGLLAPLQAYVDAALVRAGDSHVPLRAAALALQAWVWLWQGRLDEADAAMAQARDDDRWLGGQRSLRIPVLAYGTARGAMAGDADAVLRDGHAMIDDARCDPGRRPAWLGVYLAHVARLALGAGDAAAARALQARLRQAPADREWPVMAHARRVIDGALLLHDDRPEAARPLLEGAIAPLAPLDMLGLQTGTRMLAALACARVGDRDAAAGWLRPLLTPARRVATDSGRTPDAPPADPGGALFAARQTVVPLAEVDWGDRLAPAERALLDGWRQTIAPRASGLAAGHGAGAATGLAGARSDLLSTREFEVLARIAAGDSNKLIARAFDLSPHTVKRHVANILDKLALNSRGQAAAWWAAQAPAPRAAGPGASARGAASAFASQTPAA